MRRSVHFIQRISLVLAGVLLGGSGCIVAAAGAGAGGAVYLTDRGVESHVAASVARTYGAARTTFREMGITETKTATRTEDGVETRELEGKLPDRDITVTVRTEGDGAHVSVVARRSAVTWDKDYARSVLEKIVAGVR